MKGLMKSISNLYPEKNFGGFSLITQKSAVIILNTVELGQLMVFMWIRKLNLRYWSNYQKFFVIFSHSSIDKIASASSSLTVFLFFTMTTLVSNISFLSIYFTLSYFSLKPPGLLKNLIKFGLYLTTSLFFVPCTVTLALLLKYSLSPHDVIEEYEEENPGNLYNYGNLGIFSSITLAAVHLVITVGHLGFSFELRHLLRFSSVFAKSSVNIEILIKVVLFAFAFSSPFLQNEYYLAFLICLAIFLAFCVFHYGFYQPYFSDFMNFVNVIKYLESFSLAVFFVAGKIFDNAVIVLVLVLFLQPVIFVAGYHIIKSRNQHKSQDTNHLKYSKFEFAYREVFFGEKVEKDLIRKSSEVFQTSKNRLIRVIQAYYCIDILKNVPLASIKLNLASSNKPNLFTNFQLFKCGETLITEGLEDSLSVKILKFLSEHRKVMEKDKKYCLSLLNLSEKFLDCGSSLKTIEKLTIKTNKIIETLKKSYKNLIITYPDSRIILKNYGSFLIDLASNHESGLLFLSRSEKSEGKRMTKEKKLDVFSDESACILITSASSRTSGKILNANLGLCNFLEIEFEEIVNMSILDILPNHQDFCLKGFIDFFTETTDSQFLQTNQLFFLKNKKGFLKECNVTTECIGLDSMLQFVSVIEPRYANSRHFALIYKDGTIFGHTEGLPELLEINSSKIERNNIKEFIFNVDFEDLCENEEFLLKHQKENVLFSFKLLKFLKIELVLLTCFTDAEEILRISSDNISASQEKEKPKKKVKQKGLNDTHIPSINPLIRSKEKKREIQEQEDEKVNEKETNAVSNSSKQNFKNTFEFHYIQSVLKTFSYLKFLIGLLVLNKQALLISTMCLVLCVSTSQNIQAAEPLDHVLVLGKLGYDFSQLGLFFRLYELSRKKGIEPVFNLTLIETVLEDLEGLKNKLEAAEDYLKFCQSSEIIGKTLIETFSLPKMTPHKKINLYDSVVETSLHGKKVLNQLKFGEKVSSDSYCYLLYNSYKIFAEKMQKLLAEISKCEKNRIHKMFQSSKELCLIWLCSVVFVYLLSVVYYFKISRKLNFIWKIYFKQVVSSLPNIKSVLINRLSSTHNYILTEDFEKIVSKRKNTSRNFWIRYSAVTFTLVVLALLVCLLYSFIFGLKIYTSLNYRKNFIEIPLNRRISSIRMGYNVMEKVSPNQKIEYTCFNVTNFGSYATEHSKVQNEIIRLRKRFYEKEIIENVPNESWTIIFENFENDEFFIKLGITTAMAFLRFETFLYWTNPKIYSLEMISEYFNDCYQMSKCFSEVLIRTDRSTKDVITENLKSLIIYGISSILFTVFVSILMYYWYFKKEIFAVICIRNTLSYLMENEDSSFKVVS